MKKLTIIILFALIASGMTAQTDSDYTRWMLEDRLMNDTYSEPYSQSMTETMLQDYMAWQMLNSGNTVYLPADHSNCYHVEAVEVAIQEMAVKLKGCNELSNKFMAAVLRLGKERDSLQRRVDQLEFKLFLINNPIVK